MQVYSKIMFLISTLMLISRIYGAAQPLTPKLKLPERWYEAHEFLRDMSAEQILSLLPSDPSEKKEAVLRLIDLGASYYSGRPDDRHESVVRNASKNLETLCDLVQFDPLDWDRIHNNALGMFRTFGPRVADAAARVGNIPRVQEIARLIAENRAGYGLYKDVDIRALERCFEADLGTYFIETPRGLTLIEEYLLERFVRCNEPLQTDKVTEVCARLDKNLFTQVITRLVGRVNRTFKAGLWYNRTALSKCTHPHMMLLNQIVGEMEKRIERWSKLLGFKQAIFCYRGGSFMYLTAMQTYVKSNHYDYNYLDHIYYTLFEIIMFNKGHLNRRDCTVALEMFRSYYTGGESYIACRRNYFELLFELDMSGIRPNSRLYPHNPSDKRTAVGQWLIRSGLNECNGEYDAQRALSLLTEDELDEIVNEIADSEECSEVHRNLQDHLNSVYLPAEMREDTNRHGIFLKKVYAACSERLEFDKTLRGICLKKIREAGLDASQIEEGLEPARRAEFEKFFARPVFSLSLILEPEGDFGQEVREEDVVVQQPPDFPVAPAVLAVPSTSTTVAATPSPTVEQTHRRRGIVRRFKRLFKH